MPARISKYTYNSYKTISGTKNNRYTTTEHSYILLSWRGMLFSTFFFIMGCSGVAYNKKLARENQILKNIVCYNNLF